MEFDENEGIWVVKVKHLLASSNFFSLANHHDCLLFQREAREKYKLDSLKYSEIFTGASPQFEEKRAVKKAAKSDTPKTPKTPSGSSKEVNGKSPPSKTTPTKRSQPDSASRSSKSNAKSPKMDADALAKEFIKYASLCFSSLVDYHN